MAYDKTIIFRTTEEQHAAARLAAHLRGQPLAELIRQALDDLLHTMPDAERATFEAMKRLRATT